MGVRNKMKKILMGFIAAFLLSLSFVSAALVVSVSNPTYPGSQTSANPGDVVTYSVSVQNTGASEVIAGLTSTDMTQGLTKFAVSNLGSLTVSAGSTQTGTVQVQVPTTLKGAYSATLTATDSANSANKGTASYSLTVAEVQSFNLEQDSVDITTFEGQTKTTELTLKNTGSAVLSNFVVTHDLEVNSPSVLFDKDNEEKMVLDFKLDDKEPSTVLLNPGDTKTLKVKTIVDDGFDLGIKSGVLTVKSTVLGKTTTVSDTASFKIEVTPELCEAGPIGNKIKIKIDEPDKNDDFKPGETFKVEVNVENKDSDDQDATVEVSVWNLDENDELLSQDADVSIDNGDNEDLEFEFTLPYGDEIGSSDNIAIFAKVTFDDFDEDAQCVEASVPIDVKRENHEVVIKEFALSPAALTCGENANFRVSVMNIGKKEEDVQVSIRNPDLLGITDLSSNEFTLDEFDKNDNSAVKTFTFRVPENAKEGDYNIEAMVLYDDKARSVVETKTLKVEGCGAAKTTTVSLLQKTFTGVSGNVFAIPVTVQNSGSSAVTYELEANAVGGWGTTEGQDISVGASQTSTVFVYVTPNAGLTNGQYVGNVVLKQNGEVVTTETFNVNVGATNGATGGTVFQPSSTPGSFFRNWIESGRIFWILGIIVLLVLIVFFARLIFAKD